MWIKARLGALRVIHRAPVVHSGVLTRRGGVLEQRVGLDYQSCSTAAVAIGRGGEQRGSCGPRG